MDESTTPSPLTDGPSNLRTKAFEQILDWLRDERTYQSDKWDYENEPPERLRDGLSQGSWFWQNGVLNYVGRVRLFGLEKPQGRQALMKNIASLVHLAELAIVQHGNLPEGGHTSSEIVFEDPPYA